MKLSFKKRIATYFIISTAVIIALVFGTVYYIVRQTVYSNLDKDLGIEAEEHRSKVELSKENIMFFINKEDLLAAEHSQAQVNPVFIQLIDASGKFVDKSPNLKQNKLHFRSLKKDGMHFNTSLNNHPIRQVQIPIIINDKIEGYVLAAMSLEASLMVLSNLRNTLFLLYPIILVGLFFISMFFAGRSIQPVVSIIEKTNRITRQNLYERVEIPSTKDELQTLSLSINALLQRIENAMIREQQFTSDASHELRTPIAVLKGTLEVLLRKPRTAEEYNEKLNYCIKEVNRISLILDQLLDVARNDESTAFYAIEKSSAIGLIREVILRRQKELEDKSIVLITQFNAITPDVQINAFFGATIIENILVNAIKYSKEKSEIVISMNFFGNGLLCSIQDQGIGIQQEDLAKIFQPFFRSEALKHKEIQGSGLGLAIAQKAAKAINATISVQSEWGKGTTFDIQFHEILRES